MDLVPLLEAVIKSPYGLTLILCFIVWYQNMLIREKENTIKEKDKHIQLLNDQFSNKQETRENLLLSYLDWHQKHAELNTKIVQNMGNDVRDSWIILQELFKWLGLKGGKNFDSKTSQDDADPPIPDDDDSGLHDLRRKLSNTGTGGKT